MSDVAITAASGGGSNGGGNLGGTRQQSKHVIPEGGRGELPLEAWVLDQLCSFMCCQACCFGDNNKSIVDSAHAPSPQQPPALNANSAKTTTAVATATIANPMLVAK